MIHLHVVPRFATTWEAFCAETPPRSIALDGYVQGRPAFSPRGPHVNFDHHRDVDRLSTRSTCMQVFLAVAMGLFDTFSLDGKPDAHVWINDADQDTCLSLWILRHPERCRSLSTSAPLTRLLILEDILDCTGGAYPMGPDRPVMKEQAWVFQPYFEARQDGSLRTMDDAALEDLVEAVCTRITAHCDGQGRLVELDARYEEIGGGPGWMMIREIGRHARTALFGRGVRAYVTAHEHVPGRWTYTLGRMSPYVPFPVEALYVALNAAEGLSAEEPGWGGSNTIGGSPRDEGSRLLPAQVRDIVTEVVTRELGQGAT